MFLWALPLAALPVLVHLFHRRRQEVVRWGAMEFLLEGVSRRRRMWRIDDLLLMLLRASALLVIVLALARPLISSRWLGDPAGRDVIVILDDSMSTARTIHVGGDGRTAFEEIIERVDRLVAGLEEGDTVRVLLASGAPAWLTPVPVALGGESTLPLRQRIQELKPTLGTADIPGCLQRAAETEPGENALSRYVAVVTDGTAHGWNIERDVAWNSIARTLAASELPTTVNVVDVVSESQASSPIANIAVEAVETTRTLVGVSEPFTLTARVKNYAETPAPASTMQWVCRDVLCATSAVPALQPGQTADVRFEHTLPSAGAAPIRCELQSEDAIALDNRGTIIVEAVARVPVLLVGRIDALDPSRSDATYVLAALGVRPEPQRGVRWRSVFEATLVDPGELADVELSRYFCVILADVPSLTREIVDDLAAYVSQGGGLWAAPGARTEVARFNEAWHAVGTRLSPLALAGAVGDEDDDQTFVVIHPPDDDHPATKLLGDTQRLDIDDVKIYRRFRFEGPRGDKSVSVLLETGDGEPLAVEQYVDDGRVIVQGMPLGIGWSNLPACQVYVPLVHEWLWYLTQPSFASHNLELGATITAVAPAAEDDREYAIDDSPAATIDTPGGASFDLLPGWEHEQPAYTFARTRLPGDYVVVIGSEEGARQTRIPFYVERDPEESDLALLDAAARDKLAAAGALHFVGEPLAATMARAVETLREPIWNSLLIAACTLMAAELVLAGWLARRRFAPEPAPEEFA